jgi:hypothetical protein
MREAGGSVWLVLFEKLLIFTFLIKLGLCVKAQEHCQSYFFNFFAKMVAIVIVTLLPVSTLVDMTQMVSTTNPNMC